VRLLYHDSNNSKSQTDNFIAKNKGRRGRRANLKFDDDERLIPPTKRKTFKEILIKEERREMGLEN